MFIFLGNNRLTVSCDYTFTLNVVGAKHTNSMQSLLPIIQFFIKKKS